MAVFRIAVSGGFMSDVFRQIKFNDFAPESETFFQDTLKGLSQEQKTLPCKYFYNKTGLSLFNQICKTEEYYPTRTELHIMQFYSQEIAETLGSKCLLIEYGGGNAEKIKLLLNHLTQPACYVPLDISKEHLKQEAEELNRDYPSLEVLPVCADFTKDFQMPDPNSEFNRRVVYFPGSTIGNFNKEQAVALLKNMKRFLSHSDGLLIGVDLKKDKSILDRAYNDAEGFTEAFNLNLLQRINDELGGNFQIDQFEHRAFYNENQDRVEMQLVSRCKQAVDIQDQVFHFEKEEAIQTEFSHKYNAEGFAQMASSANFTLQKNWTDKNKLFSVFYLTLD